MCTSLNKNISDVHTFVTIAEQNAVAHVNHLTFISGYLGEFDSEVV